ncbi:TIGR00730 family Rossman fold protein [Curtobacterium sp. VKM Ac-1376]|uniref:LOG family protein n=1 Tax=Curtobacterium sp. VKM Ac-1376 TaxID=123312 RepID=UPI00188CAE2F|nr:TIGR00730 family Rossman fold protein [Curtobacterium sp. VKM Ac-1376]MBF4615472.1 TIGR00730 family Rossman fold protein [Curtobacterium sp. VKM Ac-1376]
MSDVSTPYSVAVFCGSSMGSDPIFERTAEEVGRECAARGLRVVFGGSNVGLMGILSQAVLESRGSLIGVSPTLLVDMEPPADGIDLEIVETLGERKRRFTELSDAVLVLPGGIGSLDEAFEAMTARQLGLTTAKVVFLSIGGFWEPLKVLLDHLRHSGFVAEDRQFEFPEDVATALDLVEAGIGS